MHVRRMGRDPGLVSYSWYWVSLQDHMHNFRVPLLSISVIKLSSEMTSTSRTGDGRGCLERSLSGLDYWKCHRQRHILAPCRQKRSFALCNRLSWLPLLPRQWRGALPWSALAYPSVKALGKKSFNMGKDTTGTPGFLTQIIGTQKAGASSSGRTICRRRRLRCVEPVRAVVFSLADLAQDGQSL